MRNSSIDEDIDGMQFVLEGKCFECSWTPQNPNRSHCLICWLEEKKGDESFDMPNEYWILENEYYGR